MPTWTFKCFLSDRGENIVRTWLAGLPKKVALKIDIRIRHLANIKNLQGEPVYIKPLTGYDGILEIRVVFGRVQYRPLCCYGPGQNDITILIGAIEKGDEFEPLDAPNIATNRRKSILEKRNRVCDYFDLQ